MDDATVGGYAVVKDNAIVKEQAYVYGHSVVGADTIVSGNSEIYGKSTIYFYANPFETEELESNISGSSNLRNCNVEATGQIIDSDLENEFLDGNIKLVNKNKDKGVITIETFREKLANVDYGNEMSYFDINKIFKR